MLEYHRYTGDELALHMAELTLTCMYRGGIFDHVGGGFSRYSTDAQFCIPHCYTPPFNFLTSVLLPISSHT